MSWLRRLMRRLIIWATREETNNVEVSPDSRAVDYDSGAYSIDVQPADNGRVVTIRYTKAPAGSSGMLRGHRDVVVRRRVMKDDEDVHDVYKILEVQRALDK